MNLVIAKPSVLNHSILLQMSYLLQKHAATASKVSLIALACLTLVASPSAANSKLESNNPFLPFGHTPPPPPPPPPPSRELEFRGIVQMNGVYEFSLFNKKLNRGYWIAENGTESGISVRNFDLSGMRITVTQNGRSEQLTLMTATDSPLPVAVSKTHSDPIIIRTPIPMSETKSSGNRFPPRRRVIMPKQDA